MRLLSEAQADQYAAASPAPDVAAECEDSFNSVTRAMNVLPRNQQECIRLKFQHSMSYKQISDITRLSVTNVGFLIHTGLKALRKELTEKVGGTTVG